MSYADALRAAADRVEQGGIAYLPATDLDGHSGVLLRVTDSSCSVFAHFPDFLAATVVARAIAQVEGRS